MVRSCGYRRLHGGPRVQQARPRGVVRTRPGRNPAARPAPRVVHDMRRRRPCRILSLLSAGDPVRAAGMAETGGGFAAILIHQCRVVILHPRVDAGHDDPARMLTGQIRSALTLETFPSEDGAMSTRIGGNGNTDSGRIAATSGRRASARASSRSAFGVEIRFAIQNALYSTPRPSRYPLTPAWLFSAVDFRLRATKRARAARSAIPNARPSAGRSAKTV